MNRNNHKTTNKLDRPRRQILRRNLPKRPVERGSLEIKSSEHAKVNLKNENIQQNPKKAHRFHIHRSRQPNNPIVNQFSCACDDYRHLIDTLYTPNNILLILVYAAIKELPQKEEKVHHQPPIHREHEQPPIIPPEWPPIKESPRVFSPPKNKPIVNERKENDLLKSLNDSLNRRLEIYNKVKKIRTYKKTKELAECKERLEQEMRDVNNKIHEFIDNISDKCPNQLNSEKKTALHIIAEHGDHEVLQDLIDKTKGKLNFKLKNNHGKTALDSLNELSKCDNSQHVQRALFILTQHIQSIKEPLDDDNLGSFISLTNNDQHSSSYELIVDK